MNHAWMRWPASFQAVYPSQHRAGLFQQRGKPEKENSVSFSLLPLCPALHTSVSLCVALCTYQWSRVAALSGPLWLFVTMICQGSAGSWGVSQMVFFAWSKENVSYNCHQKASWLYLLIRCQKITIGWPRGRFGGIVFRWTGVNILLQSCFDC